MQRCVIGKMSPMITKILIFLAAYIVGSIPIGYLFARCMGIQDIREHGSGSTGATNIARKLGARYFFLIFICDALKAFLAIMVFKSVSSDFITLFGASLFLLLGNVFPLFLQFRGGRGIATSAGIMASFNGPLFMCAAFLWALFLAYFKRIGFASVLINIGVILASLVWLMQGGPQYLFIFAASALLSLWLHKKHAFDLYTNYFGGSVL